MCKGLELHLQQLTHSMKWKVTVSPQKLEETRSECAFGATGVKSIEFYFEANEIIRTEPACSLPGYQTDRQPAAVGTTVGIRVVGAAVGAAVGVDVAQFLMKTRE